MEILFGEDKVDKQENRNGNWEENLCDVVGPEARLDGVLSRVLELLGHNLVSGSFALLVFNDDVDDDHKNDVDHEEEKPNVSELQVGGFG